MLADAQLLAIELAVDPLAPLVGHFLYLMIANRVETSTTEPAAAFTKTSKSPVFAGLLNGEGGIRTHGAREDTLVFKTKTNPGCDWLLAG